MRSRAFVWINIVFASIVVIGVFLQVYFIASYFSGAGEGALDAHSFVGGVIVHGSELLVFLSALAAFWGAWKWIGFYFLLFLVGTIQIFLAPPDDDPASGWIHGLHGLLALFVLIIAAVIVERDRRLLGLWRPAEPQAVQGSPPPA